MAKDYVEKREGGYYVAGSRVALDSIVWGYRRGESAETIRQNFPTLTLEQVYGAITFCLANVEEVDRYMREQDELWEKFRERQDEGSRALQDKLARLAAAMGTRAQR